MTLCSLVTQHYDHPVGNEARILLAEALALSDHERADLAAELLASLDEPVSESQAKIEQLWATEIERRAQRVLSGGSRGELWSSARQRIEQELSSE